MHATLHVKNPWGILTILTRETSKRVDAVVRDFQLSVQMTSTTEMGDR